MRALFGIAGAFGFVAVALGLLAASELEADYIQPNGFRIRTWVGALVSGAVAVSALAAAVALHRRR